jgi:hypothetical protein
MIPFWWAWWTARATCSRAERKVRGAERRAVDEVHRDEVAVAVGADLVDGDDVGVAELRGGGRLADEADGVARVVEPLLDDLDGDGALEGGVDGLVDGAHAAARELALDVVAADAERGGFGGVVGGRPDDAAEVLDVHRSPERRRARPAAWILYSR